MNTHSYEHAIKTGNPDKITWKLVYHTENQNQEKSVSWRPPEQPGLGSGAFHDADFGRKRERVLHFFFVVGSFIDEGLRWIFRWDLVLP